jgi:hypothetical protein
MVFGKINSTLKILYTFFTREQCIKKENIVENAICTKEYNPQLGCNNKVYSNPCHAKAAGLTSWSPYNAQSQSQYKKSSGCGCKK